MKNKSLVRFGLVACFLGAVAFIIGHYFIPREFVQTVVLDTKSDASLAVVDVEEVLQEDPFDSTALRWTTYDLVYQLSDPDRADEAEALILKMLAADPYETMRRLGMLPESHAGMYSLPAIFWKYVNSENVEVETASSLLDLLKGNVELHARAESYWSMLVVADSAENDVPMMDWVRLNAEDPQKAGPAYNAVMGILRREGVTENAVQGMWGQLVDLPAGRVRSMTLENTLMNVPREDFPLLEELAYSIAKGDPDYEMVTSVYGQELSRQDPLAATELLSEVKDPELRYHLNQAIVVNWAKKDRAGLSNWLVDNEVRFSDAELLAMNAAMASYGLGPLVEIDGYNKFGERVEPEGEPVELQGK